MFLIMFLFLFASDYLFYYVDLIGLGIQETNWELCVSIGAALEPTGQNKPSRPIRLRRRLLLQRPFDLIIIRNYQLVNIEFNFYYF